jgi:ribosomal protein S18 acetylase RimI-like enzyme
VNIRRLHPGDEAAAQQAHQLFGPKSQMDAESFLRRPEVRLFVAEDAGEVLGWVYGFELSHPDGATTTLLYALDVAAKARGQGLALQLVNACVSGAQTDGCIEAWVVTPESNPAGIATYSSAGGQRDPVPQVVFKWDFPH